MRLDGYRGIFLSGGGLKVASFVGALQELDLRGVRAFYGVSAGAILACLLCLGVSAEDIRGVFSSASWHSIFYATISVQRLWKARESILDFGPIARFIEALLLRAGVPADITLGAVQKRTRRVLGVFYVRMDTGTVVLCTGSSHPNLSVKEALSASCSLPMIFPPTLVQGSPCVDAGFFNNCPISLLADEKEIEPLLCLVTNVSRKAEQWKRQRDAASSACLSLLLDLKVSLMTWYEVRAAATRAPSVVLLEMPPAPACMHNFRVDGRTLDAMFLQGKRAVQTRVIKRSLAGLLLLFLA